MYNVFVPLVPLTACNGPTELRPGSHLHEGNTWGHVAPRLAPLLGTGDMLIFDYRLRHRGLANNSSRQHPNPSPSPSPSPSPNPRALALTLPLTLALALALTVGRQRAVAYVTYSCGAATDRNFPSATTLEWD